MGLIKKVLNLLNERVIYYELDGDDSTYSVNMLSYLFKRHNFLKKDKKKIIIKDNVSYIHFRNFMINGTIDAPSTNSVRITNKFDNFESVYIFCNGNIEFNFNDETNNALFEVKAEKAKYVSYSSYLKGVRVDDAKLVDICGTTCCLDSLDIKSERFNYSVSSNDIIYMSYAGNNLNLSSSRGIIRNVWLTNVEHFNMENCSLEGVKGNFCVSNIPKVKSSLWKFSQPLTYNDGSVGKKDNGFILDDKTFNKKECFDFGRAYVSYALSKVLEKVYDDNEYLVDVHYRKVAKQLDDLEREYDSKRELLEESRDVFEKGVEKVKIKRYVVDKNNKN